VTSLWPWLAVAGAGALHGLNPATGWMWAAACGLRSGDRRPALRALLPIATGHAASGAVVATTMAYGHAMDEWERPVLGVAAALLVLLGCRALRRRPEVGSAPRASLAGSRLGLAIGSFIASTAHGSGMMLVPALVPLCLSDAPAREITASGSLTLALAAVAVHALAMLGTLGLVAAGALHGVDAARRGFGLSGPAACRSVAEKQLQDHAGGDGHQHVVAACLHPVIAARRLAQLAGAPVVHDVPLLVIGPGKPVAAAEVVIGPGTAVAVPGGVPLRRSVPVRRAVALGTFGARAVIAIASILCVGEARRAHAHGQDDADKGC
jgi:hypothetical protein